MATANDEYDEEAPQIGIGDFFGAIYRFFHNKKVGLVLILSALAVALPDIGNVVNLLILLIMFVSPIGFTRDMVPGAFAILVDLNPVSHMLEAFRYSLLVNYPFNGFKLLMFVLLSSGVFLLGSLFFHRFKGVLVDYE